MRNELHIAREWLVTNGLGGYSSTTVAGALTRRYHGILVAALPAPLGRTIMLNHLCEELHFEDGSQAALCAVEYVAPADVDTPSHLLEFVLEDGLPVWRYEVDGVRIEKRVMMPRQQNTALVTYSLTDAQRPVRLTLRPSIHFRNYEASVNLALPDSYQLTVCGHRHEISAGDGFPPLRMRLFGGTNLSFHSAPASSAELHYRIERARGYDSAGSMWSPGFFDLTLQPGESCSLAASIEPWETIDALAPEHAMRLELERRATLVSLAKAAADDEVGMRLVHAADQFLIVPVGRTQDIARAAASGDEARTVIAGYHWFTDWGRDTMISLEGLTLTTGRAREAAYILRTFAHYIRDGLIPNMFPDQTGEGLYHTADASLWFFHALHRYVTATGDTRTRDMLIPAMRDIADHHLRGTRFGIRIDPADGLMTQGEEGYQLTWMDAKVDGWVVTPRRGKAVELNALWYNALRLLESWLKDSGDAASAAIYADHAQRAQHSFNERFWYDSGSYLYDVIDGPDGTDGYDAKCRPNQVFAISLDHPVLARERWRPVLDVVSQRLLTPFGLRSLAPGDPEYKAYYDGDLRARDAAYHQGTVWGWLIGPYIDAYLRVHTDGAAHARELLGPLITHLDDFGVGSIAEVFDATEPFTPRGCIAQAWSVAEVFRCWARVNPRPTT